jgi:pilus assembly protein Flp/PilA
MTKFMQFMRDDSGATAIEYGLIASLIAVAIIFTVSQVGDALVATFNSVATSL